jgi:hypothetical protein
LPVNAQHVEAAASVVVAVTALGGVGFAITQFRDFRRAEKRRVQPVVIVHEVGPREFVGEGRAETAWQVYLENHGAGAAFNVRFGVEFDGTPYPHAPRDSDRGYRSVVNVGQRVPVNGTFQLRAPLAPYGLARGGENVDARRVFWARYENSFGEDWETRNPGDPTADWAVRELSPHQVRKLEAAEAVARAHDEGLVRSRLRRELRALVAGRERPEEHDD